eukprot:5614711-Pyramimonas_sp.AAC.1
MAFTPWPGGGAPSSRPVCFLDVARSLGETGPEGVDSNAMEDFSQEEKHTDTINRRFPRENLGKYGKWGEGKDTESFGLLICVYLFVCPWAPRFSRSLLFSPPKKASGTD